MNPAFGVFLALACVVVPISAFKCYQCGIKDAGCLTPTNNAAAFLKDCSLPTTTCYKTYWKDASGVENINRGCGSVSDAAASGLGANQCQDMTIQSVKMAACNCNWDSCNSAAGLKMSFVSLAVAVTSMFVAAKFL